jgi:hypothetical protein
LVQNLTNIQSSKTLDKIRCLIRRPLFQHRRKLNLPTQP